MNNLCSNVSLIKYGFILLKYIFPICFFFLGLIILLLNKFSKRSFVSFMVCLFCGVVFFVVSNVLEFVLKNEFSCIKCSMENCEEIIDNDQNVELDSNQEQEVFSDKFDIQEIDGVTYVNGYMIVNKTYGLPSNYMPIGAEGYDRCNECITSDTMKAFKEMQADASSIGLNLYISSGYRSYEYQKKIYNNYVSLDGVSAADKYSARPGYSEHQTGLAFDLNTIDDSFANTAEGKWIANNCYRYGLILRYPKGKEDKTGYQYESWHLRYVGVDLASKLYNDGDWITMEEYFGLTSVYE